MRMRERRSYTPSYHAKSRSNENTPGRERRRVMDGRARSRASAFSFQLSLLSCCVSFVRPEMQPFIEEYSSNNCERHVSECGTDFSVQVKLAQISGIALKIHASGEASTNCMKHRVL